MRVHNTNTKKIIWSRLRVGRGPCSRRRRARNTRRIGPRARPCGWSSGNPVARPPAGCCRRGALQTCSTSRATENSTCPWSTQRMPAASCAPKRSASREGKCPKRSMGMSRCSSVCRRYGSRPRLRWALMLRPKKPREARGAFHRIHIAAAGCVASNRRRLKIGASIDLPAGDFRMGSSPRAAAHRTLCMAVAARLDGSVVNAVTRRSSDPEAPIRIAMPPGVLTVAATVRQKRRRVVRGTGASIARSGVYSTRCLCARFARVGHRRGRQKARR